MNYEILEKNKDFVVDMNPKLMVLDEAHYIKNPKAKRTKQILTLAKNIPCIVALTGTPVLNKPIEIYNTFKLLDPTLFPNWWSFVKRYCGLTTKEIWKKFPFEKRARKITVKVYDGASNTEELNQILTGKIMLRRRKKEVLKELPEKTRTIIQTDKLGKVMALRTWIDDYLETGGKKIVVFFTHHDNIDHFENLYKDISVKIDGRTPQIIRQKLIDSFNSNPKIKIFRAIQSF